MKGITLVRLIAHIAIVAFAIVLLAPAAIAQAPGNIAYEMTINNSTGTPVASRTVGIQVSILQGSSTGAEVYKETHTPTTNVNAVARIAIGGGTPVAGTFASIDWSAGPYFLKTEIDISGGISYTQSSTTQLLSAPYALYATTSSNAAAVSDNSVTTSKIANNSVNGTKIAMGSDATGDIMVYNGTDYARLAVGTTDQVLKVSAGTPTWATPSASGFTHYVGEYYGGGVVFHVWKDSLGAEHGLVVSTTDGAPRSWSDVTTSGVGSAARTSYDGLGNSNAIVAQSGHTSSAAKDCLDLVQGGQSDWYLPAIDELILLWHNRFNVNNKLATMTGATLLAQLEYYWSSTEYFDNGILTDAMIFAFDYGGAGNESKATSHPYRAIRKF